MKVYIASDHAGFELKKALVPFLASQGHVIEDCGAAEYVEGDDYPDIIPHCAKKVAVDEGSVGIVIGASGQGEAMAANRIPGVRAAVYYGEPRSPQTDLSGETLGILESVREHNHANVLSLGSRFITEDEAKKAALRFLATAYSPEERHVRRVGKLG